MGQRILITGGLGYIGGRLALALGGDNEVIITSRRHKDNIPTWTKDFEVRDALSWRTAVRGCDVVIHLAAMNEIESARDHPGAVDVNIGQTLRWYAAAKQSNVQRFIYFSTAHVYGAPLQGRLDENCVTRPRHPYAISHRAAEDFVLSGTGMECLVFRLSNAIGAPADHKVDRWMLVANDFCRQIAQTGQIVLKSSGQQQRDFIAMSDVTRAVEHMLGAQSWGDGLYNLGSGVSLSVLDLAFMIAERAGRNIKVSRGVGGAPGAVLDYRTDKLAETGFVWGHDFEGEIDATLALCEREFAPCLST